MKNQLAFQIKFKLTPKSSGYKPAFISGIVMAHTQVEAVEEATVQVTRVANNEPMKVEVKLQSVVKLKRDFFIIVDPEKQG
jgi:hypothetical protein